MSDRILIATRKGLFEARRRGASDWKIGLLGFEGDPVTIALDDPRDGTLYAALNLGHFGVKLHRSTDGGTTWEACAAPSFPAQAGSARADGESGGELDADAAKPTAGDASVDAASDSETPSGPDDAPPPSGPSVHQVWCLEAGASDEPGSLWAGTIPAALFRSDDRGSSWQLVDSLWNRPERTKWFGGGYDDAGIHSICVDPRDSRRLTLGISCGGVWLTEDAGTTWDKRCAGMFAEYMPPDRRDDPDIQDPHRLVSCPSDPDAMWVQHHNGVFRTVDGGRAWTVVPDVPPSVFGFAVAVHPRDPETAWLVPAVKDDCRIPVDAKVVVTRTRDGGKSFDVLRDGLPQGHAYDLVYRHALAVDAGGERLVMGSTTGALWITEDGGDRWSAISTHLPPVYQVAFARS